MMGYEYLKALFGSNPESGEPLKMSYDELVTAIDSNKDIKIVNLKDGGYVSKDKFEKLEKRLNSRPTAATAATGELKQDDTVIPTIEEVEALKKAHRAEIKALKAEMDEINKAVAIRDYLENEKFTSGLAKTYLTKEMTKNPDVMLVEGVLIGADDALKNYKTKYADAFIAENKEPANGQATTPATDPVRSSPPPLFTTPSANGISRTLTPHTKRPTLSSYPDNMFSHT